jgi:ferredoxin-type protein NapH
MTAGLLSDTLSVVVVAGLIAAGILALLIWVKNRRSKMSVVRFFVQIVVLLLFYYSFTMDLWLNVLLGAIFLATLFVGRFFCGWLCPFGFYMDLVALCRKVMKVRYFSLPQGLNRALHRLRYVFAAVLLVLPLVLGIQSTEWASPRFTFFLDNTHFKPLNFFLGPVEPLVLPFKSLLNINDGYSLSYPYVRDINYWINSWTSSTLFAFIVIYIFIALTIVSTFVTRRFWCRFCPTGISIAALNKFRGFKWMPLLHINKVEEKCTKCGICKRVCPVQVTEVYEEKGGDIKTSMCMNCFRCVEMCPYEGCLKVKMVGKTLFQSRNWLEPSKGE